VAHEYDFVHSECLNKSKKTWWQVLRLRFKAQIAFKIPFRLLFYNVLIAKNHFSGGALLMPALQRRGEKVSLLQATQLINQGKVAIVDVRDASEFATGHIRDSKNIPLNEIPQRLGELEKFKSKTVIVLCQSGVRSSKAAAQFKKAGFNEVVCLNGGLAAWLAQGLPVIK
jgi:rhodanese-related sulfurtransferase